MKHRIRGDSERRKGDSRALNASQESLALILVTFLVLANSACDPDPSDTEPSRVQTSIGSKTMADIKWGEPVAGWRLSASLDKPVFEPGERILLTVVFENASGTEQEYGAQSRDHDYVLDCATDYGQSVPLTRFGQRMAENRGHGRYITNALQPNEHLINEIVVTRHLDLTLPGKYTLSVSREIYPHEGRGQPPVKSKACEFEIIE